MTKLNFLSLPFYSVDFAVNWGDILSVHTLFLLSVSSVSHTLSCSKDVSRGNISERPKKASLFAQDN